jgi:hypothetical protein
VLVAGIIDRFMKWECQRDYCWFHGKVVIMADLSFGVNNMGRIDIGVIVHIVWSS